ncbi:MAG: ABC transporter substrate-binding protein [Tagaea sp.]|nr:ABC transporter substrate-binding protein [Tagaea sp.]
MTQISRRALLGGLALLATPALAGEKRVTLRAGYLPGFEAAPLFVMLGEGWPAAAGIDIAPTRFATPAELAQALAQGAVDSYWGPVSALAFSPAAPAAPAARIVAGTTVEDIAVLSSRPDFVRLASDPARPMATQAVRHWLAASGRNAEIVPVAAEASLDALARGTVDAVALREPFASAAGLRPIARGAEIFPDQPAGAFALARGFIAAHPAQSQRLVTHAVRAERLLAAEPARAAAPVISALAGDLADAATLTRALAQLRFQPDPKRLEIAAARLGLAAPEGLFDDAPYRRLHV